jgi:hypothetical protein
MVGAFFRSHPAGLQGARFFQNPVSHTSSSIVSHLPTSFCAIDEVYDYLFIDGLPSTPLLFVDDTAYSPAPDAGYVPTSSMYGSHPVAWTKEYGQGKVFVSAFGESRFIWWQAWNLQTIRNSIYWAASLPVPTTSVMDSVYSSALKVHNSKGEVIDYLLPHRGEDKLDVSSSTPYASAGWNVTGGTFTTISGAQNDVATQNEYCDFDLEVEYYLPEGGNSGIFYMQDECTYKSGRWQTRHLEYQLVDQRSSQWSGNPPNRVTGSVYLNVAPDGYPEVDHTYAPETGLFNKARIVVKEGRLQHYINGNLIVDEYLQNHMGKWKTSDRWPIRACGKIMLQHYNQPTGVVFKNLVID